MEISVIIPTYKPDYSYLNKCIGSLFAQTFNHSEFDIVIILNGCNEPYLSMINDIISKYDDSIVIHVIQTDVPGQSNARNMGMNGNDASYYCFIDYDDWVSPKYLERLYASVSNDSIAQSNVIAIYDSDNSQAEDYIGFYHNKLYGSNLTLIKGVHFLSNVATKLISKDIISNDRFYDINVGEDALFMTTISCRIRSIVLTESDAVYYRRIHDNSLVHSKRPLKEWFKNRCRLTVLYLRLFLCNMRKYNIFLFLHRIAAVWKGFIKECFKKG